MEGKHVTLISMAAVLMLLLGACRALPPEKSSDQSPAQPASGSSADFTPDPAVPDSPAPVAPVFELGLNQYPGKVTGSSDYLERSYEGAPPMISHSIDNMDINLEVVSCLVCHEAGMKFSDNHTATKVPASHYKNEYTDVVSEEISGIRRNCLQCHLIQSDEEPPSFHVE